MSNPVSMSNPANMSDDSNVSHSHRWRPQVPLALLSSTNVEGERAYEFTLPTCKVQPGAPAWASREYTHNALFSIKAGHSQGLLTPQSSIVGGMTRFFEVALLCKSNTGHSSGAVCTLTHPQEYEPLIDAVTCYRHQSGKGQPSIQSEVNEKWTAQDYPDRVFSLQTHTVPYPSGCTLRVVTDHSSGSTPLGGTPVMGCSVDIALTPTWKTPKLPDIGSSFVAAVDEGQDPTTTVDVFKGSQATDIVTNWKSASLIGANGNQPGAIRYVYSMTAREPDSINIPYKRPERVASVLEQARRELTQSLAAAGTSLETFVRLPSSQVDYTGPSIPMINIPISEVDDYTGSVLTDYYDVVVSSQCKFLVHTE